MGCTTVAVGAGVVTGRAVGAGVDTSATVGAAVGAAVTGGSAAMNADVTNQSANDVSSGGSSSQSYMWCASQDSLICVTRVHVKTVSYYVQPPAW